MEPLPDVATWKTLYRLAGIASIVMVAIILVEGPILILWPPPGFLPTVKNVLDWFAIFTSYGLRGLLDLDILLVVAYAFSALVYLALYIALRRTNESRALIAVVISLIGIVVYFNTNPAFSMLMLAAQYGRSNPVEKSQLVSTDAALLANYQGTAFNVSYILGGIANLLFALLMLRSKVFGRATAYTGLAMGVLMLIPPTAGGIALTISVISLLPTLAWNVLIARRFLRVT